VSEELHPKYTIKELFTKQEAGKVSISCNKSDLTKDEFSNLEDAYKNMINKNNNIFSFKYIPLNLRKHFRHCGIPELEYDDKINDKDILIVDDTISTGSTISDITRDLLEIYQPKSITILTLFSPLEK
jgi:hypothetical protein